MVNHLIILFVKKILLTLAMAGSFAACNSSNDNTTATTNNSADTGVTTDNSAVVQDSTTTTRAKDTSAAKAADETYTVNTASSVLLWEGKKPGRDHHGTVKLSDGKVIVNNGQVTGGRFTINFTTIDNTDLRESGDMKNHDKLTNHLKSADFFDVEKYPTGTFVITKVTPKNGPDGANAEVTGNLTVKGQTNPISFPAKITINGNQLIADAKFIMDRSKYNIRYGSKTYFPDRAVNDIIENDVNMEVKLVANK